MKERIPFQILPAEIPDHIRKAISGYLDKLRQQINTQALDITNVASSQVVASNLVLADASAGAVTMTLLPAKNWIDQTIHIKKMDPGVNLVLIAGQAGETIDGAATVTISTQYSVVSLISDGGKWYKV